MEHTIAIVDATRHSPTNPADREVAGLGMLERTIRLAAVSGCDRAIVVADPELRDRVERVRGDLYADARFEIEVRFLESPSSSIFEVLPRSHAALDAAGTDYDRILYLDSTAVYERELIAESLEAAGRRCDVCAPLFGGDTGDDGARVFATTAHGWTRLARRGVETAFASVGELLASVATMDTLAVASSSGPEVADRFVRVVDAESADRAASMIWNTCHKPQDGPASRYVNRPMSLALSRRIAPHSISPNEITAVSGLFGLAAGPVAAVGGYAALVLGALLYQLKSIVDGTDGEIARAKYEFTDVGAWFDKFVDDLSHLSFAVGAGIGVWRAGGIGASLVGRDFWWFVIAATVVGKLLDSAVWYGNAFRDGELVHPLEIFEWWFEGRGSSSGEESLPAALLSRLKPLTKGGVFILLALLSALAGIIPIYLVLFAAGQLTVGLTRAYQARVQGRNRPAERDDELSGGPENETP